MVLAFLTVNEFYVLLCVIFHVWPGQKKYDEAPEPAGVISTLPSQASRRWTRSSVSPSEINLNPNVVHKEPTIGCRLSNIGYPFPGSTNVYVARGYL